MKSIFKTILPFLIMVSGMTSCKKNGEINVPGPVNNLPDSSTALKEATDITIGAAISYTPMIGNAAYSGLVKRDFDGVTFDYHMKHGAVVQSDGTLNFTATDDLVNAAASLEIFGHTLGWHENQNAGYLKNFSGIIAPAGPELSSNGGFENGLTGWSTFNSGNPAGKATITTGTGTAEVRSGNGSMKVINPEAYPGNQWRVQVSGTALATTIGKQYNISYWVKAAVAGGSIRLSTGPTNPQYQGDQTIGTNWQQVSWTITAQLPSTSFLFDMGQVANTYFIDEVSVKEVVQGNTGAQVEARVDEALDNFVTGMVTHYKGKVKAWDVVNELFTETGNLRNNTNTSTTGSDVFVWSHYLGRDFALKAFNYAKAADPSALLFINDYNLESSSAKLDSLIAYVAELKSRGAKVDGIGSQMHVSWNSSRTGIDNMMKKLAATGLKVRISELDVRLNPNKTPGYVFTAAEAAKQADMYKYVIKSYIANVPKAQQHGITIWGITDNTSWLYNNGLDFPLLYNLDFSKKAAYTAVVQALKGQ